MQFWSPSPIWCGADAYVVGGGLSLRTFDWEQLRGKHVVGCNSAALVPESAALCEANVFGDFGWWENLGKEGGRVKGDEGQEIVVPPLSSFGGLAVACCPRLLERRDPVPSWLLLMRRSNESGLATGGDALAWNGNTGSLAINLALLLGARRVFLLGFDFKAPKDRPNWHTVRYQGSDPSIYKDIFAPQMKSIARDLPLKFPGAEIVNVTDDSALDVFPKQTLAAHFARELERVGAS